jgi:hypothetical protein
VSAHRIRLTRLPKTAGLYGCTLVIIAVVRIALTLGSHRAVLKAIPANVMIAAPDPLVWRAARAVSTMARLIPKATCLTQALALQLILAYRGYASELRIGVKHDESGISAHAWLLSNDRIAIGGSPQDVALYAPLTTLGGRER